MRLRDLRLEQYGISKQRYLELQAFVRQYPEWVEELEHEQDTVGAISLDGMPKGNSVGDSTGTLAIRRAMLSEKCRIVEESFAELNSDLWGYLLLGICQGKSFDKLKSEDEIPCERDTYYDLRRYFFVILDKKRNNLPY